MSQSKVRWLLSLLLGLIFLVAGAVAGWTCCVLFGDHSDSSVIAMSWGDGKYGKQFYGAQVYVVPEGGVFGVRARVFIGGPGSDYYHECGEIGRAKSVEDAIDRFGKIHWD